MKLHTKIEVEAFLDAVDRAEGAVWIVDNSGSKLNLKSLLSRYVALGRLIAENGDNLELFCALAQDEQYFFKFFDNFPETL